MHPASVVRQSLADVIREAQKVTGQCAQTGNRLGCRGRRSSAIRAGGKRDRLNALLDLFGNPQGKGRPCGCFGSSRYATVSSAAAERWRCTRRCRLIAVVARPSDGSLPFQESGELNPRDESSKLFENYDLHEEPEDGSVNSQCLNDSSQHILTRKDTNPTRRDSNASTASTASHSPETHSVQKHGRSVFLPETCVAQ